MISAGNMKFSFWLLLTMCLINVALGFVPIDNYLINCGSSKNTSFQGRVFTADHIYSNILSTPQNILANTSLNSDSNLYETARIFTQLSNYTLPIKQNGRHFVRLHFYPFDYKSYNTSSAKFSVSVENLILFRNLELQNASSVKEYSLNITRDKLVLTFSPSKDSFAFVNALEFVSVPFDLISDDAKTFDPPGNYQNVLTSQALETVARVNMGGQNVPPENDTLSRKWDSDKNYIKHANLATFLSNPLAVNYIGNRTNEDIAPRVIYGTATKLRSEMVEYVNANVTWLFEVDSGFEYLVRFHFCDIASQYPGDIYFNVYINSWLVYRDLDLSYQTSNRLGVPFFRDVVAKMSVGRVLSVSMGPSGTGLHKSDGILNGLEIMKINTSLGSLDRDDIDHTPPTKKSRIGVVMVCSIFGTLFIVSGLLLVIFAVRRRRLIKHSHVSKCSNGGTNSILGSSKIGASFPFAVIKEATRNFSEDLIIGVGGFGKVYKGVLGDETKVAVKRGNPNSRQGFAEFRTEIEMLSQFRHRHLVSLIGYCDERGEMIIIYEYMEKGTVKDHLYSSDLPRMSWKRRLNICIGSARGIHYLHTGSVSSIIHRDIKSANILLDESFTAKVADFGLSKIGPDAERDQTHVSTAVKGSFGYLDPEYLTSQQLTDKSDVFSFGVVLFEMLCGRPVIDPSLKREKVNLIELALKFQRKRELLDIVDPHIAKEVKPGSLKKFGEIGEKCLAERGVDRPTMGDVLWQLECALQLQVNEEASNGNDELNKVGSLEASTTQFSFGSATDLEGISMSEVFSNLLKS